MEQRKGEENTPGHAAADKPEMVPTTGNVDGNGQTPLADQEKEGEANPTTRARIMPATFDVFVAKDSFHFTAAHFVAFEGFRERLHGHNYSLSVRLQGSQTCLGPDGYVVDYGFIKKVCKEVCKEVHEHFLCPSFSTVLKITQSTERNTVRIECPDGTYFEFPEKDCKFLPIVHATTEELAIYLWSRVMEGLDAGFLRQRGIQSMELAVAEAPGQQATFRYPIQAQPLDVRAFVPSGSVAPLPCRGPTGTVPKTAPFQPPTGCGGDCKDCVAGSRFSPAALASLTKLMKAHGLLSREITTDDLQALMQAQK